MKALILAAGLGTRLRPLTNTIPKVLAPVAGKPLLEWHLDALRNAGVKNILINSHYLPNQIDDFVLHYRKLFPEIDIVIRYEPQLLGSAGTLSANREFFEDEEIVVVYGDNLTTIDYKKFFDLHHENNGLATIASYKEMHPETKGIIYFDEFFRIEKFVEKPRPEQITTNWANGGIYVFSPKIFAAMPEEQPALMDFGHHIFPHLLENNQNLYVYLMEELLLDIGTPESYAHAQVLAGKMLAERKINL